MADLDASVGKKSVFEHMSTEDLQEMLRLDIRFSDTETTDAEYTLQILEVLARRKKEDKDYQSPNLDAAWGSFKENYLPYSGSEGSIYDWDDESNEHKSNTDYTPTHCRIADPSKISMSPRRGRLLRLSITAAAFVIISTVFFTSTALGGFVWQSFAQWTLETFGFSSRIDPTQINEELVGLHEALADYGIATLLAPIWLPDGFVLADLNVVDTEEKTIFLSLFQSGGMDLTVQIVSAKEEFVKIYEKDTEDAVSFRRNEIDHYVMTNDGKTSVVWTVGRYECGIIGSITEDEAIRMIDSIYER